ncbi:glycosyl transferase family 90-domain-containing protein [Exophiala viscosa]|uniref:Glycosyl transferase family 90-domain-containing protein n=2 Tax=Exophiala viscosa TaxID=2486360 RepID=A0AAN6DQ46_9EURO|nr:glycosyl transferase family 90-domain-containing protein [Exophiala viscosa]
MAKGRTHILPIALVLSVILLLGYWKSVHESAFGVFQPDLGRPGSPRKFNGKWNYKRDADNLMLNSQQCEQAFPGLFEEVERPVRDRLSSPITLDELDSLPRQNGYVRAMIYNQQLYVIDTTGRIYSRGLATLHALHRAILSSPEILPNIEFAFNVDDRIPPDAIWGYARQKEDTKVWLIPDFGFWSWPETKVGSMREVQMKATMAEQVDGWSWSTKIPKLLWRGATMGLELRENFVAATADQPWADVKALTWRDNDSMVNDLKSMPEHCQYKFLAHTEGNSYSGRLKYLQNCKSVIVAHKMDWIQHHHHLMRSSGPEQNYVEVKRSFEDLAEKISWLQDHNKNAEKIASRNVKVFRERYLTPAAEVCYWRKLIHGWSRVSFEPEFFTVVDGKRVWRGLPIESFLLEKRLEWDPY